MVFPVIIRWGKENINISNIFEYQNGLALKQYLYTTTGVNPERQTITGIGKGILKDNDIIDESTPIKKLVRMMGTSDKIPEKPKEELVFLEDVAKEEEDVVMAEFPPGLTNLGNTCYMNSTIQLLKTVPEIKNALINFNGSNTPNGRVTSSLRDLYKSMDESKNGQDISPYSFVNAVRQAFPLFNASEQTPVGKVYSQQDAEEFLNTVRNAIVQELQNDNPQLSKLFVGKMDSKYTNQETDETPDVVTEEFHSLKCFINKETKHLLEGLSDGLKGSVTRYSPKLEKDATFSKESVLKDLPPYLMINFVRFFWKQKEQIQNKIIKKVKFPLKLDIAPLCSDSLRESIAETRKARIRKEQADMDKKRLEITKEARELKEKEEVERAKKQGKEVKQTETKDESTPQEFENANGPNGDYELIGLVTHKGRELTSGHYIGWIKENGKWIKFDDDKVNDVSENEILELAGGGDRDIAYITLWKKLD